jgi:Holliday junction resolvase
MTPEGKVKAKVKALLKKHGAWNFTPVSNGMGVHGIPDIIACHHGRFLGIECKAPNKKNNVSPLQKLQINGIKLAEGIATVIATDQDLEYLDILLQRMTNARAAID